MARHFKNVPEITPDDKVDGNTVASPALGYGMERVDFLDTREQAAEQTEAPLPDKRPAQPDPTPAGPPAQSESSEPDSEFRATLGRNEVAAVSTKRSYYVNDVPSPYLSSKQAREDVAVTRRRHSRISLALTILLVLGVLGAGGWYLWSMTQSPSRQTPSVTYETRMIEGGEYLETIDTTSLIRPANEVVVTANASGSVAEVFVEDGAAVEEGQWLLRIDNPTINDALKKAENAVDEAQKDVDRKSEALNQANEVVTKAQEMLDADPTNQTAKAALEVAKNSATTAQNDLDSANNTLWSLHETLSQAQEQKDMLTIAAPISGTVSELSEQVTSNGSVSGSTRLCTISDRSHYSLVMEIPKADSDRVEVGQEVRLSFPSIEDLSVVSSVASLDEADETLMATVLIEDPDERIEIGMAAEASLILKSVPDAFIVPASAIRTAEDGTTYIDVLLDSSRGIVTAIQVNVVATDGTKAAVDADSIQVDTAVVIHSPEEQQPEQKSEAEQPAQEQAQEQPNQ